MSDTTVLTNANISGKCKPIGRDELITLVADAYNRGAIEVYIDDEKTAQYLEWLILLPIPRLARLEPDRLNQLTGTTTILCVRREGEQFQYFIHFL